MTLSNLTTLPSPRQDRSFYRPAQIVADDASQPHQAQTGCSASEFVLRGEWLAAAGQQSYQPQYSVETSPRNRLAIASYRFNENLELNISRHGQLLDQYI